MGKTNLEHKKLSVLFPVLEINRAIALPITKRGKKSQNNGEINHKIMELVGYKYFVTTIQLNKKLCNNKYMKIIVYLFY